MHYLSRRLVAVNLLAALFVSAFLLVPTGNRHAVAAGLEREGRTLTWDGEPIHLIGYCYYGLLGDRHFDAESFLEVLAAHNINFTRFFLVLPWPVEPGPNLLPFAKTGDKYDLREYDATGGAYTAAEPVVFSGSGKWKSATFGILDATFGGRQNDGADFRFSLQGGSRPLAIRSVRVVTPR